MPASLPHPTSYFVLLAFCGLLGLGLVVLAWLGRQRRIARAVAGVVAAAALWLSAFPPLRQVPAARGQAILLTESYSPDTLRQLLRRLGPGTPVWSYGNLPAPVGARPLGSLLTLVEQRPTLRGLHLLGQGLSAAELPLLGTVPTQLHATTLSAGLSAAFWDAQLPLGEAVQVEGSAFLPKVESPAWVCLRAAGAVRDSVRVPAGGAFRLRYRPKTAGLAVYELLLRRAGRALAAEPVPVEITVPQLPAVLLLTATPSFEFKYLKNYLAEAHYPLALRTGVSRGLVQTDFVNQSAASLDRLTPTLLARYTLVVADAATLAALAPAEASALQAAIGGGQLGLVVVAEAAPLPRAVPGRADFAVQPRATAQSAAQPLTWPDAPAADARAPLPAQLGPALGLHSLVSGPNQAMAAASRRVGLGFVVVSVVPETFQWGLQGHGQLYGSFWNRLLTAAAPPAAPLAAWRTGARWPRPHQPLTLHLTAAFPETQPTVRARVGGPAVRLALRQDTRLPEWSTAQYWPQAAGWHQVNGPGRTMHNFYVYPVHAWAGPAQQERQTALAQRASVKSAVGDAETTVAQPWPSGWFFGLFLLAAGYLWLEEKL